MNWKHHPTAISIDGKTRLSLALALWKLAELGEGQRSSLKPFESKRSQAELIKARRNSAQLGLA